MLPSDVFAEMELLGNMLSSEDAINQVVSENLVTTRDIFSPEHYLIFNAIVRLYNNGDTVTPTAVASGLGEQLERAGGLEYIQSLRQHAGSVEAASERVARMSILRNLIDMGALITQRAQAENVNPDDLIASIENDLFNLRRRSSGDVRSISDVMSVFQVRLDRQLAGDMSMFTRTNLPALDDAIGFVEPNDYVVVGGRPGDGKSSVLKYIAYKTVTAPEPKGVYIADFEEGEAVTAMKLVSIHTGISTELLRNPQNMSIGQLGEVSAAIEFFDGLPLYIDSMAGVTADIYKAKVGRAIRRCRSEFGVELGFHGMDYITLARGIGESDVSRATQISQAIRGMCQPDQLNKPFIGTAQLNRTPVGSNGRPREYALSDLRETGALEQDATIVIFPSRPWMIDPPRDAQVREFRENVLPDGRTVGEWRVEPVRFSIAKNRNGPTGRTRAIVWHRYSGRYELDERTSGY